jgi:hypothetical protein
MKSSTRDSAASLRHQRPVPGDRRVWAGLRVSAERLVAGLDASPEVVSLTSGSWSVVKLLGLCLARVGRPAALDCWTWTLSRKAIAQLQTWAASDVTVRLVVDSSLWRRQPTYGAALLAGDFGASVRACSSHVKAARLVGPAGSVFIAGSGNLNLCRRAELLWLSRDPALAAWLEGLTTRAFDVLPAGSPMPGSDADLDARLAAALPSRSVPSWAAGLPVLGRE